MMGGNFGSAAGAFLLVPVLIGIALVFFGLGAGAMWLIGLIL